MNVLKTQASLMQFLFIAVALIVFASAAEAQTLKGGTGGFRYVQQVPPVEVLPGGEAALGEYYVFKNKTDKRCVASLRSDGKLSVGCSELGGSKVADTHGVRTLVIIEKVKDKYGKSDEVSLRVAERK